MRCAQGCYDAAVAYGAPFISGKDSLNNEYTDCDGTRHAIPGTLLISALGMVPDVTQTVTSDLKHPGDLLYLVGENPRRDWGGSHCPDASGPDGGIVPQPNAKPLDGMRGLHSAVRAGLVRACHDCSEGGIGSGAGGNVYRRAAWVRKRCMDWRMHASLPQSRKSRFIPSRLARFVVEVHPEDADALSKH